MRRRLRVVWLGLGCLRRFLGGCAKSVGRRPSGMEGDRGAGVWVLRGGCFLGRGMGCSLSSSS